MSQATEEMTDVRQSLQRQAGANEDMAGPSAVRSVTRAGFQKVPD